MRRKEGQIRRSQEDNVHPNKNKITVEGIRSSDETEGSPYASIKGKGLI